MWKLWWVIWNETQSGHRCSADHNLHKTSHFVTFDFSLKLIIGRSSNNTGKSCHYIKSTRGQLVFKMNFTGISCYLINHLNLTIWGLNKAQCQYWALGTPNKEPRGERFNVASPSSRLSLGQYHTSYLCQNLSVFTSLLHVTKPHRPLCFRGEAWPGLAWCRSWEQQLHLLKTGRISTLPAC